MLDVGLSRPRQAGRISAAPWPAHPLGAARVVSPRRAGVVCVAVWLVVGAVVVGPPMSPVVEAQSAGASAGDAAALTGLRWRNVGPNRGGRSIAVAGSERRPLEYYFGATGGGLWKTADGGATWRAVGDGQFRTSSVGALAVAPSNPDIVYVGFGEVQLRGNIIQGDGVYRSIDGGKTFTHVGLEASRTVSRLRVHPTNPDVAWAAVLGDPYAATPDRGVYVTRDGGRSWTRTLFRDDRTGAADLVLDPGNPDVVFASLWEVNRTPHSLSSGGPGSGLFKSSDGGATWVELTRAPGLPEGVLGKIGVSVSGADSQRVYAMIEAREGGLFRSDDAGGTWTRVSDDRNLRQRAFYYTRVYADPKARDTVYVLNVQFHKSTDGGRTFRTIRTPHSDNHDLWIAADDPERMVQGNDGGANVSVNGGQTWTGQQYPTAQMYNVFTTSDTPYMVCGAQQDNTTACVSSAGSPNEFHAVGGCESGYIAQSNADPDVFFAGCYGGSLTRYDRRTKVTRAVHVWPDNPMGHSASEITERFQWTFPIVVSPHEPGVVYAGSQHVWRSRDEGQSWSRISPDLTRHDPSTMGPSGGPITLDQTGVETYATVFTIAPSRLDRTLIWAGSDDGLVHVTRDDGGTWRNVTPPDLPDFTRVSLIEASPHRPGTAYLAGNRYQRADRAPYVYRTDDYGQTWTAIVTGLPATDFARVIREDPIRAGLLYLGTEHGIYVSFDNGGRWQSLQANLPATPVHGIVVEENDLVIGTHGRSFWILDDIAALRQMSPDLLTRPLHVFTPGPATRRLEPTVPIDYHLKTDAKDVTVEILDAAGAVVREMKSRAAQASPAASEDDEDGPRAPGPPRVTTKAGMNRVAWDMRRTGARDFPGMVLWAGRVAGPIVLPGAYTVRVTADGHTMTAPLVIRKDPRTGIADADLAAQHDLARAINQRVHEANEAVLRIRHIRAQVAERAAASKQARLVTQAEALSAALTGIEGEIYQYRNRSSQDPLNYPIKVNNKLAALQGVVEAGDGAPTSQSRLVFEQLSARLSAVLQRLDTVIASDVRALNVQLRRRKVPEVSTGVPTADEVAAMAAAMKAEDLAAASEAGDERW